MGDLGEMWREQRELYKQRCKNRNDKFEPILIELGAIKKSEAVYIIGDYLCYPTKGFAMHKKTYKKKKLDNFIKGVKNGNNK